MKICCSENICPLGFKITVGPDISEIIKTHMWAYDNKENEYALGVLAALNFIRGFDDKSPADRIADSGNIHMHANPIWVSYYLEYLRQGELGETATSDPDNSCSQ